MESRSLLVKPKGKMRIPPTMVGTKAKGNGGQKPYSKKKNRRSNKV